MVDGLLILLAVQTYHHVSFADMGQVFPQQYVPRPELHDDASLAPAEPRH